MKYLVIAAVAGLIFVFVYRRLKPYLQLLQKIVSALNVTVTADPSISGGRAKRVSERQLVRCLSCGTWIPADRALKLGATSIYCSAECLEKKSENEKRKLAG